MKDVTCITSKTSLLQCTSDPLLSGGCSHSQDAGVECEGKTVIFMPNRPVHDIHYDNRMASSKEFLSPYTALSNHAHYTEIIVCLEAWLLLLCG